MGNSLKALGTAVPVLAALVLAGWVFLIFSMTRWIGVTPVAGRETDKMMLQAWSGGIAFAIWLLLGGLLLMANARSVMPSSIGFASWLLLPVSGLLALLAIAVMYDPQWKWLAAIPIVTPILIAGYVVYLFLPPAIALAPDTAGMAMWALVLALCVPVIPAAARFKEAHYPKDDSIDATPGPELDRWMARQKERQRQDGLAELRAVDETTTISTLEPLARDGSPVRNEALQAIRQLPEKQEQAENGFLYQYTWILTLLPDLDVKATPKLCDGARYYLRNYVKHERAQPGGPSDSMGMTLEQGIRGIGWLAEHCNCRAEIELLDELARSQQDTPAVRSFRASLAGFLKK